MVATPQSGLSKAGAGIATGVGGASSAASGGSFRVLRWWLRQPIHARRAFRGLLTTGVASVGYAGLLARPSPGALGTAGRLVYAFAGWGAYPLLALLLAWGIALLGTGITRQMPLSRVRLASAFAEWVALLAAVRLFWGGGGWLAGILTRPIASLPIVAARAGVVLVVLLVLFPLLGLTPPTLVTGITRLGTRRRLEKKRAQATSANQAAVPHVTITPTPAHASARPSRASTIGTPPLLLPAATRAGGPGWGGHPSGRADLAWQLPPLDLFDAPERRVTVDQQTLLSMTQRLDQALRRSGIAAQVQRTATQVGPSVLTFVLRSPRPQARDREANWVAYVLQRRDALTNALAIPGARVGLPSRLATARIAEASTLAEVWVEVPHPAAHAISLHEVLTEPALARTTAPLMLPLGRTTTGEARALDLRQSPHLLIGGRAGSGKSTELLSLLTVALARATPHQVALALADPTQRTLLDFEGLPHLLAPIATTSAETLALLDTALAEAQRRERLLVATGAPSFAAYAAMVRGKAGEAALPWIVLALDAVERWDAEVQRALASRIFRLASLGRLTGVSLLIAGELPAAASLFQALEGVLAARLALPVASAADARLVLGASGAEHLERPGDLLYLPVATGMVERLHAARVTPRELHRLTRYWQRQAAAFMERDASRVYLSDHLRDEPTLSLDQRSVVSQPQHFATLPPLPGRQSEPALGWGRMGLANIEGPHGQIAQNAPGGLPLAMMAAMMRSLTAQGDDDSDNGDGFGAPPDWVAGLSADEEE